MLRTGVGAGVAIKTPSGDGQTVTVAAGGSASFQVGRGAAARRGGGEPEGHLMLSMRFPVCSDGFLCLLPAAYLHAR